jgi:dienelactone hydrolase
MTPPLVRRLVIRLVAALLLLPAACAAAAAQTNPNHPGLIEEATLLDVKGPGGAYRLEALIVRQAGATGRLPIALLTHGKPRLASDMATTSAAQMAPQSRDLAYRGYLAVAVVRRGHGKSGGTPGKAANAAYANCNLADLKRYFSVESEDLEAALRVVAQRPDADPTRAIVIGASVGGGAAIALAARKPQGLVAVVNLAGGMRITNAQGALVCPHETPASALASFGAQTKIPMLWVYSQNDSFFSPDVARKLHADFTAAGGVATLRTIPALPEDGHHVFERTAGRQHWLAALDAFLRAQGLPTWTPQQADAAMRINNIPAGQRVTLEGFLSLWTPRVLVQAPNGTLSYDADTKGLANSRQDGLAACQKVAGAPCRIVMENFSPVIASAVFAKSNLLGTFALDCKNLQDHRHIVHRALDNGAVQHDLMSGTARVYSYVIDRAQELGSRDVSASMANDGRRLDLMFRAEGGRIRVMESGPPGGPKIITGGNYVSGGEEPWYNRCGQ